MSKQPSAVSSPGSAVELSLAAVARRLELLEETLIYRFLDRVQFGHCPALYRPTEELEEGQADIAAVLQSSLLGQRLQAHEDMELQFGRYSVAEEFPFSPLHQDAGLANAKPLVTSRAILQQLPLLHPCQENLGEWLAAVEAPLPLELRRIREISQCRGILRHYLDFIAKYFQHDKDRRSPMQYGSALEHDVMALQAISRRIHFGALYVAEIKYQQGAPWRPLLRQWQRVQTQKQAEQLRQQILEQITRAQVEQRILQRVYDKASAIQVPHKPAAAGEHDSGGPYPLQRHYLEPAHIRAFYAQCVIPLTREGELAYLYRRA